MFEWFHCKYQSQALTKRGRAPSKKWSGQNLTGRTVGSGPAWNTEYMQLKRMFLLSEIII